MTTIRKAAPEDIPFIEKHAYRLLDFGPPQWRKPDWELMTQADITHNTNVILGKYPDTEEFIAVDESGTPVGFLQLTLQEDYYTKKKQAHLTDIVVIKEAEGRGVGKELMQYADDWARSKGAKWITLNVFEENRHAQAHYEKAGYSREWIRYLKVL